MSTTAIEVCRAIYSLGLLFLGAAVLFFLPVAFRVVRDLTAALAAFTATLGSATSAAESQRKLLVLTEAIAERLGVRIDP